MKASTRNQSNSNNLAGKLAPPSPGENFVVSQRKNGEALSFYGDMIWDLSPQCKRETTKIYFQNWGENLSPVQREDYIDQIKWILYLLTHERTEAPLVPEVLNKRMTALAHAAEFCVSQECTLFDLFSDAGMLHHFMMYKTSRTKRSQIRSTLTALIKLSPEKRQFSIVGSSWFRQNDLSDSREDKQTPPIPTRIYSNYLAHLKSELDNIEIYIEDLCSLIAATSQLRNQKNARYESRNKPRPKNLSSAESAKFQQLISKIGLDSYLTNADQKFTIRNLIRRITEIQVLCRLQIIAFSGVRRDECDMLPFDCISSQVVDGHLEYEISGFTSKYNNGIRKETTWTTSEDGQKAIRIAQKIAKTISESMRPELVNSDLELPLFISCMHLPFTSTRIDQTINRENWYAVGRVNLRNFDHLFEKVEANITESDLNELEFIDPHRSWRSESAFFIGTTWKIKCHQLRRSLALYASTSGFVSLPSLRRQLKHITQKLSLYYGKGSSNITKLLTDTSDHFAKEYQAAQTESQGLAYIKLIYSAGEKLFGAHGMFTQKKFQDDSLDSLATNTRESTLKQFKNGELAYKETPLGGCTQTTPCLKRAFRSVVGCLECTRAIIKPEKLLRTIKIYEHKLSYFSGDDVAQKMEERDLSHLTHYYENYIKPKI